MTEKEELFAKKDIRIKAAEVAKRIKELGLEKTAEKRALRRNRIQKEMALLLCGFMEKHKITSLKALAYDLYIGWDHEAVLHWLRCPIQFYSDGEERDREYLRALSGEDV